MKPQHDYTTSKVISAVLAQKDFKLQNQIAVGLSGSTRRMLQYAYVQKRLLERIKRILRRRNDKMQNAAVRADVKKLKSARRIPTRRVRTREGIGLIALPKFKYVTTTGVVGNYPINGWNVNVGEEGNITDYSPIARLNPPRNIMWAGRERRNSLSASAYLRNQGTYRSIDVQKCKFGALGLSAYTLSLNTRRNIVMDDRLVTHALSMAQTKIYSANLQLNEYLYEWRQVFELIKDPYKTVLRAHRLLDRWTRRNAWIWVPDRLVRKTHNGVMISKTAFGGQLMSMRTREFADPGKVSRKVIDEACNRWLQYRYGIMPLALDITTVMNGWVYPSIRSQWLSQSARLKVSLTKEQREYTYTVSPLVFKFNATRDKGEFYAVKQWYKLLEEPPMSFQLGVHPSQWMNALWNGLPYSFVADWVVNVDDWLKATTDVPWIKLGPNVVTRKVYERVQSSCINICTTSSPLQRLTIVGDPRAIAYRESVHRNIDYPRAQEPFLSSAWYSVKNAITALTLLNPFVGRGGRRR